MIKTTIFAEALMSNREFKNARINGEAVGVLNAKLWGNAVKACRLPSYRIRSERYNAMRNSDDCTVDQSALYDALKKVIDLIGEVNGRKLNIHNVAEEFISASAKLKAVDISIEMADARLAKNQAKKAFDDNPSDENATALEAAINEVKRLEGEPGNCKKIMEVVSESAFIKAVEVVLGDAILGETMKTAEEVASEEAAKKAERKARQKAKRQAAAIAKKAAQNA